MPGNRILVDTNAVVAFFRPDPVIKEILAEFDFMCLPVVVLGELKFGIEKSTQKDSNTRQLQLLISECPVIPVVEKTTDLYASIQFELKSKGKPIPVNDLWIAALAMEHEVPILTRDRHFDVVDGLETISW